MYEFENCGVDTKCAVFAFTVDLLLVGGAVYLFATNQRCIIDDRPLPSLPTQPEDDELLLDLPAQQEATTSTTTMKTTTTTRITTTTTTSSYLWCGKRKISSSIADKGTWPWLVSLVKKNPKTGVQVPFCVATIISNLRALTSLSCLKGMSREKILNTVGAIYGKHLIKSQEKYIGLSGVVGHPKGSTEVPVKFDMAVLTFSRTLSMGDASSPICLPVYRHSISVGRTTCYTVGWQTPFKVQTQCQMGYVKRKSCRDFFGAKGGLEESAICFLGKKDCLCRIASGGEPFMCEVRGLWNLYGVVSDEEKCTSKSKGYKLYARVSYSLDWICCAFPDILSCVKSPVGCALR